MSPILVLISSNTVSKVDKSTFMPYNIGSILIHK